MTAIAGHNTNPYIYPFDASTSTLTPTDITQASPAVVTVADASTVANGQPVRMSDTGFDELDGYVFVAVNKTGNTFELLGSDTTGSVGTLSGAPVADVYLAADRIRLDVKQFTIGESSVSDIDVGTFYSPQDKIPGLPTAGSLTITGFIKQKSESADYIELRKAEKDAEARAIVIELPNRGYLFGAITVGTISWADPIGDAVSYTATCSQSTPIQHEYE